MPGHRKRRQFKQTDAFTRGMVIGLKRAGWSIRQIAADTHLGASTVHRLWRRWLEQGNVAIYRNVGATRVTSARVDRRILRQAVAAPQATCTAILQYVQDTLDHSISTRTISRRLVANGLHSCRPLRRLPLTPPNRRQRLEWCRVRSTWMTEWHRVVFSDESRFCLSSDSRRVRVWRRRGERSNPAAIVERPTVRQRGIMVWGAIAYDSRSPLLRIQGTMTAQRYVDDVLRPDNARPHTARISQQALQDVQMLPWPPYSPDLSPIEHVCVVISDKSIELKQINSTVNRMEGIKPPAEFVPYSNEKKWETWRESFEIFAIAVNLESMPLVRQRAILKHIAGEKTVMIYKTFHISENDTYPNVKEMLDMLTNHFKPFKNTIQRRNAFFTCVQKEKQGIMEFVTELKHLAQECEFENLTESLIRDRLIIGILDREVKRKLLEDPQLTLPRAISIAMISESTCSQVASLNEQKMIEKQIEKRNWVKDTIRMENAEAGPSGINPRRERIIEPCKWCGQRHKYGKCPAYGKKCKACGKTNHFSVVCRTKRIRNLLAESEAEESCDEINLNEVAVKTVGSDKWSAVIIINGKKTTVHLDTGAQINVLPHKVINQWPSRPEIRPTSLKAFAYGNTELPIVCKCNVLCQYGEKKGMFEFIVADVEAQTLITGDTCEKLEILRRFNHINTDEMKLCSETQKILEQYHEVFQGVGLINSECKIYTKPEYSPVQVPPRRIPTSLGAEVQSELICLDPRKLNEALVGRHFQTPAPAELLHEIPKSKYYTVLDVKSAYWHIPVAKECRDLLVMTTPFGKFRYNRLPFGLKISAQIFVEKMTNIFRDSFQNITYVDDLLIYADTIQEHNKKLKGILEKAKEKNIKFDLTKAQICLTKVRFLGHLISQNGIDPEPNKIDKLIKGQRIKSRCKESWDGEFDHIKECVRNAPSLAHFDKSKMLILQCDASKDAMGAALLQEDRPLAFASESFSDSQKQYSQFEKELLSVYYGCKKSEYLLSGHTFVVQTDHQPLLPLVKKPLSDISPRLQRLVMKLIAFDFKLQYKPGKYLIVADTLSRDTHPMDELPTPFLEDKRMVKMVRVNISDEKLVAMQKDTREDPALVKVIDYVIEGWPICKKDVDEDAKVFFDFRHRLYLWNDLLCIGSAIVIPKTQRNNMLNLLHQSHQGISAIQGLARESLFWPRMSIDIAEKPLKPFPVPDYPWQTVSLDIFYIQKKPHLLVVDRYSGYPEVFALDPPTAINVKNKLRETFARFGIPETMMSDNGPPFRSEIMTDFCIRWGEDAWCQMHPRETWTTVKISAQADSPQSFEVVTPSGNRLIRNQQFIRPRDGVTEKSQLSSEPITASPEAQHPHYDSPTMGESSTAPIQRSIWDIIGRRLHALPQPRSEDELWQMVEREWRAIPQDAIRTQIDSLPRRVAACIAVRGNSEMWLTNGAMEYGPLSMEWTRQHHQGETLLTVLEGKLREEISRGRQGYTDDLKQWTGRHEEMKRMAEEKWRDHVAYPQ
ncbi:K02A2.6-like [Cordylochernes scorpioides]|uniref:K02A2.6-like n=1 Tax=Cordylochernes scorpioides TaxID=51811 RepID=A0ABY6LC17_9ARAC|nr:K02A2.6-like [Cordylochernes scorpioides]